MTQTPEELAETPIFRTDAFSEVLDIVHVRGEAARMLTPASPRLFAAPAGTPCVYIVQEGALLITPDEGLEVTVEAGQIALMLQGTAHQGQLCPPQQVGAPRAVLARDQEKGAADVRCFCGQFSVDGALAARVLQALPQVIVLDGLTEDPIEWLEEICGLILRELGATQPGASLMVSRLLDLLLVVCLRRWAQSDDSLPGWLAAAKDDRIARAIAAIHSSGSRTLSNGDLAEIAGMSVSNFAERFKQVMGQGPGAYLRGWRLDQAAEALRYSSASIDSIAERVGYGSKEAFSRAFLAKFGESPSVWRGARQG